MYRPTAAQRSAFESILDDSRETYNAALQERRDAWKLERIGYYDQCKELTELRKDPRFAIIAADIQREPLRRVDNAFKGYFRRCKAGQKPGYPRFKSKDRYTSFGLSVDVKRLRGTNKLMLPNLGHVRFRCHQEIIGTPKQAIIKRQGNKWIGRLVCDIGPAPSKIVVKSAIGIDLGLTDFITISNGRSLKNPKFADKCSQTIAGLHKNIARKKRGSKNRIKAKEQLRRAYQRLSDNRSNFCHHVSKYLVGKYDLIAHEDLEIAKMVGDGRFFKSIMGTAWGVLLFQLAYKAESAGKTVVAVDPRGTTQRCSGCSKIVKKEIWDRQHDCPNCGLSLSRDHNAAINVLTLGRSVVGKTAEGGL